MPSYLRCAEIENKRVELPVELNTEAELTREIARLRAELARREREKDQSYREHDLPGLAHGVS